MNKLKYIGTLLAFVFAVALPSMAQDKVLALVGASSNTYVQIDAASKTSYFGTAGGTNTIKYKTNTAVTPATSVDWCKAVLTENGVSITVDENKEAAERTTTVVLKALDGKNAEISVKQLGTTPAFYVIEKSVEVNGYVCSFDVTITANSELNFTMPDWIKAEFEATEMGTKKYTFSTTPYTEQNTRTGNVAISIKGDPLSSKRVKVSQTFSGFPHFAVISDTHFSYTGTDGFAKQALTSLYAQDPNLDAIIVNGDLVSNGTPNEYADFKKYFEDYNLLPAKVTRYYVMGGHEWFVGADAMKNFNTLGHDHCKYFDIKGYPFIYIGMTGRGDNDFSDEVLNFLKESLDKATKDYAGKPVFVFTHVGPYGTVNGTRPDDGGWGCKKLTDIMSKYPQVISFSGHTHFSIRDTRSIWQGSFTAINDGSNDDGYIPETSNDKRFGGGHPSNGIQMQEAVIVSVESPEQVKVRRIDTRRNTEIEKPWLIEAPFDGTNMPYASYKGGDAPSFEGKTIKVEKNGATSCTVTFDQAVDNDIVLYYSIKIKDNADKIIASAKYTSDFFLGSDMPANRVVKFANLPDGVALHAEVTAYDEYFNASAPLVSEVFGSNNTPDEELPAAKADLFDLFISGSGKHVDLSGNLPVSSGNNPVSIVKDEVYGINAAIFEGNEQSYFRADYSESEAVIAALQNECSFECLFKPTAFTGADASTMFSTMESGGLGLELDKQKDGSYRLSMWGVAGGWQQAMWDTPIELNKYYHAIGTYSKSDNKFKLYVDGQLVAEKASSGNLDMPKGTAYWFGVGAGAKDGTRGDDAFIGAVLCSRFYGHAVTDDEAAEMYKEFYDLANAPAVELPKAKADVFDLYIDAEGNHVDLTGNLEIGKGEKPVAIVKDEVYGINAAVFEGDNQSYFRADYSENEAVKAALANECSFETLFKPTAFTGNSAMTMFSTMEVAGLGLEFDKQKDGTYLLSMWGVASDWQQAKWNTVIEADKYYHAVGTFSKSEKKFKLYVNGEFVAEAPVTGDLKFPKEGANWFGIGAGAKDATRGDDPFIGSVLCARVYGHAATDEEAAEMYKYYQDMIEPEVVLPEAKADLFDLYIDENGNHVDLTGHLDVVPGNEAVEIVKDDVYGINAAKFAGTRQSYFRADYSQNEEILNALVNECSFETLFKPTGFTGKDAITMFSSMEGSGLGLEFDKQSDGSYLLSMWGVAGGWKNAEWSTSIQANKYYHAIGTYSKSEGKLKLYVDGKLVAEKETTGDMQLAASQALWFGIGAGASNEVQADDPFIGSVLCARVYGHAVTDDEAAEMYKYYEDMTKGEGGDIDEPVVDLPAPKSDVFDFAIASNGKAVDLTGKHEVIVPETQPVVYHDEVYDLDGVKFDGSSSMYYRADYGNNEETKNILLTEFSFETLFNAEDVSKQYSCMFSTMESGGMGFELDGDKLNMYSSNTNNSWFNAQYETPIETGKYYHAVGTYNKATQQLKLYVNGELVATVATSGDMKPAAGAAQWFGVGADANGKVGGDNPFKGSVLCARVYAHEATAEEVAEMFKYYNDRIKGEGGDIDEPEVPEIPEKTTLFSVEFGENGAATDHSPYAKEITAGPRTPETYYNETYKRWFAKFDGGNGKSTDQFYRVTFQKDESDPMYSIYGKNFAIETLAVINNEKGTAGDIPAIVSSQESGGFGIEPTVGGDIQIWAKGTDGKDINVKTGVMVEKGRVYHIVGVVDEDNQKIDLYVDGEFAGSAALSAPLRAPGFNTHEPLWVIGGDAGANFDAAQYPLNGEIGLARMYNYAPTAEEIKALYESVKPVVVEEPKAKADLFDLYIDADGNHKDLTGKRDVTPGSGKIEVVKDETYGINALKFDGSNTSYLRANYYDDAEVETALANEFSFETLFNAEDVSKQYSCMFSSMESGGVGFELDGNKLNMYAYVGGWKNAKMATSVETGKYYHAVGTYSKSEGKLNLFVNGELVSSLDVPGDMKLASGDGHWFGIGADSKNRTDYGDNPFKGTVLCARVYAHAATAEEVAEMYKYYNDKVQGE